MGDRDRLERLIGIAGMLTRATAETQTHAGSAKDQDQHLMTSEPTLEVTNTLRGSFTTQFTHILHGKIARAASSFHHIKT
jgi:hypothetical protein